MNFTFINFICSARAATEVSKLSQALDQQVTRFSSDILTTFSTITTEEKLKEFSEKFKLSFKTNRNGSISSVFDLTEESGSSLEKIVNLVLNSPTFLESRNLVSENDSKKFLAKVASKTNKFLAILNKGKNSEKTEYSMKTFFNLFIDALCEIKPEIKAEHFSISKALATVAHSADIIVAELEKNSNEPNKSDIKLINDHTKLINDSCLIVNEKTDEIINNSNINKELLLNAYALKTYIVSIGSALQNFVALLTSVPSADNYNKVAESFSNLNNMILFLSVRKDKVEEFKKTISSPKTNVFFQTADYLAQMFFGALSSDPNIPRSNDEFYIEKTKHVDIPMGLSSTEEQITKKIKKDDLLSSIYEGSFKSFLFPLIGFAGILVLGLVIYKIYRRKSLTKE